MWKWLLKLLLHSMFFQFAGIMAVSLASLILSLALKAGGQLPVSVFHNHFLWFAMLVGFGAGSITSGASIAGIHWLNPVSRNNQVESVWKQPQFWSWLPYLSLMVLGTTVLITEKASGSVLSDTHISITEVLNTFFARPCSFPLRQSWPVMPECGYQIFTMIFLAAIGYSLAVIPICLSLKATQSSYLHENTF